MGGFMYNGFGAADSYYPIKSVGKFYCNACNKEQEFSVMELKRKIRVLYIPTLTINSKFAVACNKCKNGYYIDDNQKNGLLYGRAIVKNISENGPNIVFIEENDNYNIVSTNSEPIAEITPEWIVEPEPQPRPNSQPNLQPNPQPINQPIVTSTTKKCPNCGFNYVGDPEICVMCGEKLK